MKWSLLLTVLIAAACGPTPQKDAALPTLAMPATVAGAPYVVIAGDELAIKFYKNPELNEDVTVRPDGMISLQLVDDVPAAGRTPSELGADLKQRYAKELAEPSISVIVRKTVGDRIYVGGEVGKQGVINLVGGLTLFQAIQEAGGFTKTAHRKQVVLIRRTPDGKAVGRSIDVRPVQTGERPQDDVMLAARDVIFVPRSKIADVDVFVEQYIRNALPIQTIPVSTF
ncbi:MAG: polysaccharide biosynthesis/export family protein [Deltaproteobacteria bacterium]|nr:polysaccharide biosynthesis/export family protein [Deltaproteobacteria bacterium]